MEEKSVFKNVECRDLHVPLWPELALGKIWNEAMRYPGFANYVPSEWREGVGADRAFFFAILASLAPDYLVTLIEDCRRQRIGKVQA